MNAPEKEYVFCPGRRWRFDYAWVEEKVALEVDGAMWAQGRHSRGTGDMEKLNEAAILGWRVLRCTPQQYASGEAAELVARAIGLPISQPLDEVSE